VLVEFEAHDFSALSASDGTIDIVVIAQSARAPIGSPENARLLASAVRVLREGGRVIVIEGTRKAGGLRLGRTRSVRPTIPAAEIQDWLAGSGLRGARILAESEGVTYAEASKPRG